MNTFLFNLQLINNSYLYEIGNQFKINNILKSKNILA